ncbi:Aldehyde/histidinol dehydrogenase [Mucidula mucida]|nr:Aldehyde/histidinol dehydrogenase [Mucidula mucida]
MDMESGPQSGFNSPWVDSNRSESTPAMSALFAEMFPKYVDPGVARVVNGGVEVMYVVLLLLDMRWAHPVFTGSTRVTTPTVRRAGRILWGKVLDAGQTCIAPDYVLVPKELQSLSMLSRKHGSFAAGAMGEMVTVEAFKRVAGLLKAAFGGDADQVTKAIAPMVVVDVPFDDALMSERRINLVVDPDLDLMNFGYLDAFGRVSYEPVSSEPQEIQRNVCVGDVGDLVTLASRADGIAQQPVYAVALSSLQATHPALQNIGNFPELGRSVAAGAPLDMSATLLFSSRRSLVFSVSWRQTYFAPLALVKITHGFSHLWHIILFVADDDARKSAFMVIAKRRQFWMEQIFSYAPTILDLTFCLFHEVMENPAIALLEKDTPGMIVLPNVILLHISRVYYEGQGRKTRRLPNICQGLNAP